MRVYVIEVINDGFGKISQEGYDSLEKAQAFIEKRGGEPQQLSPCHYRVEGKRSATDYLIHDILVR